jgi:hypothetical protein
MLKKVLAFTASAVLALTAASAADGLDELYHASADAVDNDSVYFGDLLDWDLLMYPQMYGLISIDSENKGNLGAAINLKKGSQLHAFWNGNLWEENPENEIAVLYGKDKMAFEGQFFQTTKSYTVGANTASFDLKGIGAGFGMNVNKKFGFTAGLIGLWGSEGDIDCSNYTVAGSVSYKHKDTGKILSRIYGGWTGNFTTVDAGAVDVSLNTNTLWGKYKFQYKVGKDFTYGFVGYLPITFVSNDDISYQSIGFELHNGFVARVKPTVNFAAGIETVLPSLNFGDYDNNGEFSNSFYMGCGIEVTKGIELDISANIKPTTDDDSGSDGESLDEIWKQTFAISVSIHL